MIMPVQQSDKRPLYVDFDLYTDGDTGFKGELILLLIGNLRELLRAWQDATTQNSQEIFRLTSHKVKPTLSILNDIELTILVEDLNLRIFDTNTGLLFSRICEDIISSLEKEIADTAPDLQNTNTN